MFRGSASATVDDRGRLKIPTDFRRQLEERWGSEVFITSPSAESTRIYPLPVWEELETKLLAMPKTDKARNRFLERVNYFGQQTRLDPQGRVVSTGGRVLSVVATGPDVATARDRAYGAVAHLRLDGSHHRTDIAVGI